MYAGSGLLQGGCQGLFEQTGRASGPPGAHLVSQLNTAPDTGKRPRDPGASAQAPGREPAGMLEQKGLLSRTPGPQAVTASGPSPDPLRVRLYEAPQPCPARGRRRWSPRPEQGTWKGPRPVLEGLCPALSRRTWSGLRVPPSSWVLPFPALSGSRLLRVWVFVTARVLPLPTRR